MSSSRNARVRAALSTVRMICTLRTESPCSSRWFRNICTAETDKRLSWPPPRPGIRYSRMFVSYSAYVAGRLLCFTTCSSQYSRYGPSFHD